MALAAVASLLACASVFAADPESGPLPSAAERAVSDAKSQLAQDWLAVRQGRLSEASFARKYPSYGGVDLKAAQQKAGTFSATSSDMAVASFTGGTLGMAQRTQSNSYYCGPAVGYEILKYLGGQGPSGETVTQSQLG
jgi:hypothetical protein